MGDKANTVESAESTAIDEDDTQNPEEATVVMDTTRLEPLQDDDATVILDKPQ